MDESNGGEGRRDLVKDAEREEEGGREVIEQ
jgi:hypothetical protein